MIRYVMLALLLLVGAFVYASFKRKAGRSEKRQSEITRSDLVSDSVTVSETLTSATPIFTKSDKTTINTKDTTMDEYFKTVGQNGDCDVTYKMDFLHKSYFFGKNGIPMPSNDDNNSNNNRPKYIPTALQDLKPNDLA